MAALTEWTTHQRSVKAPFDLTTNRAPGRRQSWTAEAGEWRATRPTEKGATDAVTAGVSAFVALYRPPVVFTYAGHTAVLSLSTSTTTDDPTWETVIVRPDGTHYSTSRSAGSWDMAEASARYSLAHTATDWHDDASVQAGAAFIAGGERFAWGEYGPTALLDYAAWQRAARHAMSEGMTDWHERATRDAGSFAVPSAE